MSVKIMITELRDVALRSGRKRELVVVRGLLSEILVEEKKYNVGTVLTDDQVLAVVTREKKKFQESLLYANQAGRKDLIEDAELALKVIDTVLPASLIEEEVYEMITLIIRDQGPFTDKDMGKVMKVLSPQIKNRFDGKRANEMVRELLTRFHMSREKE